jgi:hypothetical protein
VAGQLEPPRFGHWRDARRSPAERETACVAVRTVDRFLRNPPVSGGSTSAAGRVEGDPPVRSAKRPPRLGSQSDRSPVPRRAGDSVGVAVHTVGRLLRNPPVSGGSTSAAGRVEGGRAVCGGQVPPRLGSQGDRSPVPRRAGDRVGGRPYGPQASTQSPGLRGIDERRRPSRGGPCGPVCQAAPSARVAERPLAGPPRSGRQRLYGRPRFAASATRRSRAKVTN